MRWCAAIDGDLLYSPTSISDLDLMTEPIMIRCEGSLTPTAFKQVGVTMCRMCGHIVEAFGEDACAVEHQRQDLIAMIARGDFDA